MRPLSIQALNSASKTPQFWRDGCQIAFGHCFFNSRSSALGSSLTRAAAASSDKMIGGCSAIARFPVSGQGWRTNRADSGSEYSPVQLFFPKLKSMTTSSDDMRQRLADRLRMHRERCGLSREQLAASAGVRVDYIRDLENVRGGEAGPGAFLLAKIARALKTPMDNLVGDGEQNFEGFGLLDLDAVAVIEGAKSKADLEKILWPARYRFGVGLSSNCKIVTDEELCAVEARCNAKILEILQRKEGAKTKVRK